MAVEERDIYHLDGEDQVEEEEVEVGEGEDLEEHMILHHFYGF